MDCIRWGDEAPPPRADVTIGREPNPSKHTKNKAEKEIILMMTWFNFKGGYRDKSIFYAARE